MERSVRWNARLLALLPFLHSASDQTCLTQKEMIELYRQKGMSPRMPRLSLEPSVATRSCSLTS